MKNINLKVIIVAILMIAAGCSIGAASVSALSADGESLLNGLVSAGSSLGIDIGGIVSSVVTTQTTTEAFAYSGDGEADLSDLLNDIGIGSDVLAITDLVAYLNRGGSFEVWIYDNYGRDIEIPASVKAMSTENLVLFLMGNLLYPEETRATTTKYVFSTTEGTQESSQIVSSSTTVYPSELIGSQESENATEIADGYTTGDADLDGNVTAKDARKALRAAANLETFTDAQIQTADVNGDGRITANDARSILRHAAKLTSGF